MYSCSGAFTFSSVHTIVLKSCLYHVHHEQLIMEVATKTCSLEMAAHKFYKFNGCVRYIVASAFSKFKEEHF